MCSPDTVQNQTVFCDHLRNVQSIYGDRLAQVQGVRALFLLSGDLIEMEKQLRERLTGPERNAKTVNKIISNLKTIYLNLGNAGEFQNLQFLNDFGAVQKAMSAYTLRSFKTYVASAGVALEVMGDTKRSKDYLQHLKRLRGAIDEEDNSNVATTKQAEKMVSYDEIVKARDAMAERIKPYTKPTNKQYQDIQAYMLLCFNTMCNTVMRNQEFCKMQIVNEWDPSMSQEVNYYLPKYNLMYIFQYKTAKTYGKITILLSDELGEILRACLAKRPPEYGPQNGSPFLIMENGKALTLLQNLYKRAGLSTVSPTIMRNIVATHRSGPALEAVKNVIDNSRDFGHSVSQHLRYIRNEKKRND